MTPRMLARVKILENQKNDLTLQLAAHALELQQVQLRANIAEQNLSEARAQQVAICNRINESLLNGARQGSLDRVKMAVELGANIHHEDENHLNAYMISLIHEHRAVSDYFYDAGVRLDARKNDKTILQILSEKGDIETLAQILPSYPRVDADARDFFEAHRVAKTDGIKQLLADTILRQAAKQDNASLAERALAIGASTENRDRAGYSARALANYFNGSNVMKFFAKPAPKPEAVTAEVDERIVNKM